MLRFTTHIFLLLAVVCGQALSGVSCCCLARSLYAGCSADAGARAASAPRCPKCAAHVDRPVGSVDARTCCTIGDVQSNGGTCSCMKRSLVANQSDERPAKAVDHSGWMVPASFSKDSTSLTPSVSERFNVPASAEPPGSRSPVFGEIELERSAYALNVSIRLFPCGCRRSQFQLADR